MSVADEGGPPREVPGREPSAQQEQWRHEYWRRNLRLMIILLAVWFVVSYVLGILLAEPLNQIVINGFPLGFWFAQQGSLVTFVVLIFVYATKMDKLDDEYGVSERDDEGRRL